MNEDVGIGDGARGAPSTPTQNWRELFLSEASFRPTEQVVASAWHQHAPFAFWLMEALRPRIFVELGAHAGFSYFAICQGVRMAGLGTAAFAVDCWTGDEHAGHYGEDVFSSVAIYNQQHYADFSTLMRMSFNDALGYFSDSSIDLLHIDGRHYYDDVKSDFEAWLPKLSDRAVVLFHDTNVRERGFGVQRFWDALSQRYPSFHFVHGHGLGVLGFGAMVPPSVAALFNVARDEPTTASIRAAYARLGIAVSAEHYAVELTAAIRQERDRAIADQAAIRADIEHKTATLDEARAELMKLSETHQGTEAALASARQGLQAITSLEQKLSERDAALAAAAASNAQHVRDLQARERDLAALTLEARQARRQQHALNDEIHFTRKSFPFRVSKLLLSAKQRLDAIRRQLRHGASPALFAAQWYLDQYPDVAWSGEDPFGHYLRVGAAEGRNPHVLFNTSWYLLTNPDVAISAINPLVHFSRFGAQELRNPHPLFDSRWYAKQNPDVVAAGMCPLEHYLSHGATEGRDPHPLFDSSWYLSHNPDVADSGANPLAHFVEFGARELRSPHPLFDCRWYVDQYPDVLREGVNPLLHYLDSGAAEHRDPCPGFSTAWYRTTYPEVGSAIPLIHYLEVGAQQGFQIGP